MKSLPLSALLLVVVLSTHSQAQTPSGLTRPPFAYHHASTAQEGILRGWAEVISAAGENAFNRASAAYIGEQAEAIAIDNDVQRASAYWAKRQAWKEHRYGDRSCCQPVSTPRPKPIERLPSYVLGPSGTSVRWPGLLMGDEYRQDREVIEHALVMRACGEYGAASLTYDYSLAARERMFTTLKSQIKQVSPRQYLAAKAFIKLVSNETLYAQDQKLATN